MGSSIPAKLIAWQKTSGRNDLPWQGKHDPYPIWLSEVMLQQTQVSTVIPYFNRFLARFPDVATLAAASLDDVLKLWAGLGYYTRGRNLHRAAQIIVGTHGGRFPRRFEEVAALPGVGRSTAAAICVFAYGAHQAILDGNVKRVLARLRGIKGYPGEKKVADRLWQEAEKLLPRRGIEAYTQGLMDLGATVCTRGKPRCPSCPLHVECVALKRGWVAGLPGRKPRKARPHKRATFLVLTRAGEVLLEKRPVPGIWGGMWCLPEAVDKSDLAADCLKRFGARILEVERMPTLSHDFTHFSLAIQPLRLRVSALAPQAAEPGVTWLSLQDARSAAIPVPVKKILAQL